MHKIPQLIMILIFSLAATKSFADCPDLTDQEMEKIDCLNSDVVKLDERRKYYACSFRGSAIYQSEVKKLSLKDLIKARGGNITINKERKAHFAHSDQCEYDRKDGIMMFHYEKPAP